MFYKTTFVEKGEEVFARDKMILDTIDLSWSRRTCGV
jgi:hypothetical protein